MLKRRKGSLVPYSTAKTAYGLCADVIRAIEQEPKRVHMRGYIYDEGRLGYLDDDQRPACGMAGCFAGWAAILATKSSRLTLLGRAPDHPGWTYAQAAGEVAANLIGMTLDSGDKRTLVPEIPAERTGVYNRSARHEMVCAFDGGGDLERAGLKPGTKKYAKAVIRRIRYFMKKNRSHLLKQKIGGQRAR